MLFRSQDPEMPSPLDCEPARSQDGEIPRHHLIPGNSRFEDTSPSLRWDSSSDSDAELSG